MKKFSNTAEFGKIFGNALHIQSQLDKKHIINGKSLYGGALNKSLDEILLETFKPSDTFIVFFISHDESEDTMTESYDETLDIYDSFIVTVSIYGDKSDIVTAKLYGRLLTDEVLAEFHNQGIHVQTIDNNGDLTDFLNGYLVKRRDLIIHFSCQIDVDKVISYESMEEMSDMDVYSTR